MSPVHVDQPFYSPKNIPLWICLVLLLAIGAVGMAHQGRGASAPSAAEAAR